jgi:N-acetylglucosaminyl-diphospho-decaprenol L-rhamnosyltransferase
VTFPGWSDAVPTAVIIVSYRGPEDVVECLHALDQMRGHNGFGVFIVENAGHDAWSSLVDAVAVEFEEKATDASSGGMAQRRHLNRRDFLLPASRAKVAIAEAEANLGYGGGINSWLEQDELKAGWSGYWILNPDTTPEPEALLALTSACAESGAGMAGSVIVDYAQHNSVLLRGMRWRRWRGDVCSIDRGLARTSPMAEPDGEIDAPSGASIYVTRKCLDAIGPMSEEYFLYFEDLDWGMRAKMAGLLCRADGSFVPHKHGRSVGSAKRRGDRSPLSVYLDARNALIFTRRMQPSLLPVTVARSVLKVVEFFAVGSHKNGMSAASGLIAGLKGETGRPSWLQQ